MSDNGGGTDDLLAKKKEFVESFFRKGIEFAEELLRENEKLRFRIVQLEEQQVAAGRPPPSPGTLKELVEKIHALEEERTKLLKRFESVEAENKQYSERFFQIERENNNLASMYVAAYQLHSTLDPREVLQIVVEILLNFVGAKRFALYVRDESSSTLQALASEGVDRSELKPVPLGAGVMGQVAQTGEPRYQPVRVNARPPEDPGICFALRIKDRILGVVAIWSFLVQKTALVDVDYEIFDLLGAHAASALEAARLAASGGASENVSFAAYAGLL